MDSKPKDGPGAKSVVLIGTSHEYQIPSSAATPKFQTLVEEVCVRFHIRAIAEEFSSEGLAQKDAAWTVCKEVADALHLRHRYCDPNNQQRGALGVRGENDIRVEGFFSNWDPKTIEREVRKSHAIRERYWLERLLEVNCWPTLFVCGANHVVPFQTLLRINEISSHMRVHDWAPK